MIKPEEALAWVIIGVGCGVIIATVVFTCVIRKPEVTIDNTTKACKVVVGGHSFEVERGRRYP